MIVWGVPIFLNTNPGIRLLCVEKRVKQRVFLTKKIMNKYIEVIDNLINEPYDTARVRINVTDKTDFYIQRLIIENKGRVDSNRYTVRLKKTDELLKVRG